MVKELFLELTKVSAVIVRGSDSVRLESIVGVARESFFLLFFQQKYGVLGIWSPASLSHISVVSLKGLPYGAVIFSLKWIKHFSIV